MQLVQKREKWKKSQAEKNKIWEKTHQRNAKRVLKAITSLEGLWVKAGQYLSTRADVLPDPYIQCLRQLQDSLPPRPVSEVLKLSVFLSVQGYIRVIFNSIGLLSGFGPLRFSISCFACNINKFFPLVVHT